ncbi:PAS domain-containing protein [Marinobacter sp. SS21]|uniref:PAS domain-containing protein n=1 Tax=Marinobacter sp. SS21 TaxID=2979460 RepID=UPI00232E9EBD|nr:PAS domain-containing protein [Marinobacter sp. SS21]MDC0662847.1 PAS domain-containing protein [Marinobacter sp. SS21]
MPLPRPSGRFLVLFWLPLLLLVLGLGLTWRNTKLAADSVQAQAGQMLAVRQRALATLLETQRVLLLESSRLLVASPLQDVSQFRGRASALMARHPMLQSVELIRRVPEHRGPDTEVGIPAPHSGASQFHRWGENPAAEPVEPRPGDLIVQWSLGRDGIGEPGVGMGLLATSVPHWQQALAGAHRQQTVTATPARAVALGTGSDQLIRLFLPVTRNELLSLSFPPERWLGALYGGYYSPDIQLTVHDLSQHTKTPLYQQLVEGEPMADQALRTEVAIGDRYWMLASVPTRNLFGRASAGLRQQLWWSGLGFALLVSLLLCWPIVRGWQLRQTLRQCQNEQLQLAQNFANLEVEKTILHQALEESGQRSRDLIGLAGGFIAEVDEQLRIGFISDQVAELLDQAPAEMVNQRFDELVTPPYRDNFLATLKASREERGFARIDLELQGNNAPPLPVSLRLKALANPVHGCVGYRISALPRH